MRRPRLWFAPTGSGGLGFPSGLTTGPCHCVWLDGDRQRREIAVRQVPGRTDRGLKTPRRDAERRCRVPLFPGNPGSKPRLLPRCAFRRPVSPQEGERELKAKLARRREDASAWLFEI